MTAASAWSRKAVLANIETAYGGLGVALAGIDEVRAAAPRTGGQWSVTQVIAHVANDEAWLAAQLEALVRGEVPTSIACYGADYPAPRPEDFATNDQRNAWHMARLAGLTLAGARAMAAEAHARVVAAVAAVPEGWRAEGHTIGDAGPGLTHVGHIRRPRDGEPSWPLSQWVGWSTFTHYPAHAADTRALGG